MINIATEEEHILNETDSVLLIQFYVNNADWINKDNIFDFLDSWDEFSVDPTQWYLFKKEMYNKVIQD